MKKKKKITSLLVLFFAFALAPALLSAPKAQAAADASIILNPSTTTVNVGDTFTVDVMVNPGPTHDLSNGTLTLNFDRTLLSLPSTGGVINAGAITNAGSLFTTPQGTSTLTTNGNIATATYDAGTSGSAASTSLDLSSTSTTVPGLYATFHFTALAGGTATISVGNSTAFFADDDPGNDELSSTSVSTAITISGPVADTTAPIISAFTLPATSSSLTVPITTFTATDNVAVTGYCVTTINSSTGCSWSSSAPASVVFSSAGSQTAYAWAKDAAGNVSASSTQPVVITIPPIVFGGSPNTDLASSTTQATVSVTTNEPATCSYSTTQNPASADQAAAGTVFSSMTPFTTTGGTAHSFLATGLNPGTSHNYYVRCQDTNGNSDLSDYTVSFSVDANDNPAPPLVASSSSSSSSSNDDSSHKDSKSTSPARSVSNSRTNLTRGMTLIQRGKKFSKNTTVLVYYAKFGGGFYPPVQIKTTSSGGFMIKYTVNKPKGTYGWYAVDTKTGKKSRTIYYKVRS